MFYNYATNHHNIGYFDKCDGNSRTVEIAGWDNDAKNIDWFIRHTDSYTDIQGGTIKAAPLHCCDNANSNPHNPTFCTYLHSKRNLNRKQSCTAY